MTFEEWFFKENGFGPADKNDPMDEQLMRCWNTAILSSLHTLMDLVKKNIDDNDFHVYLHEDLRKLLTS